MSSFAALQEAVANLELAIEERRAVVSYEDLPVVLADHGQLVMLLQNLIGNGIKFNHGDPPQVHVSAVTETTHVTFSVRDKRDRNRPGVHGEGLHHLPATAQPQRVPGYRDRSGGLQADRGTTRRDHLDGE